MDYDAIVIGAGPAGEVVAGRLGEGGLKVVLVERELVGGECAYWACMPSKALLRPGELLDEVERVPGAREAVRGGVDVAATLARRDEVIHDLDDSGQVPWLEERKVEVVRGHARLDGERRVRVQPEDGEEIVLEAERAVVVATGTGASFPPIPGLDGVDAWTNREITTAKHVPASLIVIGAGVVGVEMAQAYTTLGARVFMHDVTPGLLPREEDFAGEMVAAALKDRGVEIACGVKGTGVRREGSQVVLDLEDGRQLVADEILVAAGRKPHTDDLGVETVGLEPGESIAVDDLMRVSGQDWLYAVGDVNGRALLTHSGKYQARLAADHILGRGSERATHDGPQSPRVVFTDPQVAAVGHTTKTAREAGLRIRTVEHSPAAVAAGSFHGKGAEAQARLVIDDDREVVVGATFAGPDVAELLHAATIAVVAKVPLKTLGHAIPCFPTRSEVWLRLLEKDGL